MMKKNIENQSSPGNGPGPYDEVQHKLPVLLQYWQAVFRHKLAIGLILSLAIVIGIVVTLLMTPFFTSTSRIEINRSQDKVTNVEGIQSEDVGQNLEFYQTQYSLLEAKSLAERVARVKRLSTDERFFELFGVDPSEQGLTTPRSDNSGRAERAKRLSMAADILQNHVTISPIRGSSLVDISFSSPDPKLSADIANAWVSQFIESNLDRRFDSTADARKFLEERLAQLRSRLEESERQLVLYADRKQIVTLNTSQDAEGKTISRKTLASADLEALNDALAVATAERILAESEAGQRTGNKTALLNTALNGIREQRANVASEYAKLLTQFEPEYPAAKALKQQIDALDDSIAKEEARARVGTQARYREALERERNLRNRVNQLKERFSGERRNSIQYNIYQREVDTNRQLYDGLLQRYKEIGVAGVGSNNISVVDAASPPEFTSSPNLILNLAIALFSGLFCAAAYVFVMEQIDQSVKDTSDLKNKLGIAPLGSVPDLNKADVLELLADKKSLAWEAYLSIRTSISFLTDHGVPRSFLITSSRPNEGKSTSALALAAVLSSTGKRILLIDGDMRNPSLHKMFGMENKAGLSNYLAGSDNIDELIVETSNYEFLVMTAGPIPPNAAELLSNSRMTHLVQRLNERFDCVIIDAPPVLGLADIPLLANSVEGVIYTIEANGVKLRGIEAALQRIRGSHAHIFGGIVTKVSSKNSSYGYDYEYSYGLAGEESTR